MLKLGATDRSCQRADITASRHFMAMGVPKASVFPILRSGKSYSIAEPGCTDAVEFDDGKLMCGKHESLKEVNWANLIEHLPEPELLKIVARSELIALVNWTMLTHMDAIWRKLLARIAPRLRGKRRWLFIDLRSAKFREMTRECPKLADNSNAISRRPAQSERRRRSAKCRVPSPGHVRKVNHHAAHAGSIEDRYGGFHPHIRCRADLKAQYA